MPKYFIYARKSTDDEERQQLSIPAQIDELKAFSQKENLEVADTLIESKTAKKAGRNIYLLDTKKLVDLKFPTVYFQNNPNGLFMLSIAFGQSKYYVDSLSENTKRGLRQKIRQGGYPSLAPVGYLNERLDKTISIDRKKAPIILEAFNLYSTGNYSMEAICKFLAANKVLGVRANKLMKVDIVKRILTNPFYYGYFRYNGELYPGRHKALITQKFIREEILAGHLNDLIKKHSLPDQWGKEFYQRIDAEEKTITQSLNQSGQALKLELKVIQNKLASLLDSYLDKVIDRDDYLDKKNQLMGRKKDLEEQLINLLPSQTAWLGPFRDWVKQGLQASRIADQATDYYTKRQFLINTGSDFRLKEKKAYFLSGKHPAALGAAATIRDLERDRRVELLYSAWKADVEPIN